MTAHSQSPATGSTRGMLAGIGAKVTLIAVVPILLFAALSVAINTFTTAKYDGTLADLKALEHQKSDVLETSILVEERALDVLLGLNALSQGHARMLLTGNNGMVAGVEKTRAAEAEKLKAYADAVLKIEKELDEASVLSGTAPAAALNRKRINYLVRAANALAHLYEMAVDANGRTLALVGKGDVTGARNNFVFEESARLAALTKTVNKSSAILKDAVESAIKTLETSMEAKRTASEAEIAALVWTSYGAIALILLLLGGFAAWFAVNRLSRPVRDMVSNMTELSAGNLNVEIPTPTNDEIGDMAKALAVFKENALRVEALRAEQEREQEAKEARQRAVEQMIASFENAIENALEEMARASGSMGHAAEAMSATAHQTSAQGQAVAAASTQAASNVQTVATASEELSASIQEVTRQVAHSAEIAASAAKEAAVNRATVSSLVDMANRVGEVVGLINDIAEQTNLLALNATIEAARAGEAGKGFAVVASEVKNLANQTAKATEDISAQITAMQEATQHSVSRIQGVGKIIDEMNEISTSIASAMEEQDITTQEIARNVQEAARGTQEVDHNINGVNHAANQTGEAASEVLAASRLVNEQASLLRSAVEKFLDDVKAA